ncbi:MAG: tetratricopeptide repeat protein [Nostoc sp.]|uniref:tetratricopeptide repeat protein n=1 Tax=Nostoc sp. TaxID=1180 RepID=UPI002FF6E791
MNSKYKDIEPMPKFTDKLNEDFPEVHQLYEWNRFYLDLLNCNAGDGLQPKEHSCLKAIAINLDRDEIAKKLNIASDTIRYNLRKPYELIKMLFPDETTEGNMTERKARYLILSNYKKIPQASVYSFGQKDEPNYEASKNIEDISLIKEYTWQTIEQVQPYIDNFQNLCDSENYTKAFYTIFDTDDYENCVYNFLSSHGYLNIVIALYERLIESWIPRKVEKWEFITTLACLGDAHDRMGNHEIAIGHYQNCLKIAEEIDDIDNIGGSLVNLGLAYFSLENYEEALDYSRLGLEIAREIGNREFEAHALNNLGMIYSDLEEYQLAIDYYHFSLEVKSKLNDPQGAAGSLINIGNTYRQLEKYEQAISYLQRGIEAAHHNHHNQFEANGWFNLALALKSLYHYSDAISAYEEAFNLYQQMEMIENAKDCRKAINQMAK